MQRGGIARASVRALNKHKFISFTQDLLKMKYHEIPLVPIAEVVT